MRTSPLTSPPPSSLPSSLRSPLAMVVAAQRSGLGKTLFACALLALARSKGKKVRACKLGPDYLDPQFLSRASGRSADSKFLAAKPLASPKRRHSYRRDRWHEKETADPDSQDPVCKLAPSCPCCAPKLAARKRTESCQAPNVARQRPSQEANAEKKAKTKAEEKSEEKSSSLCSFRFVF